MLVPEGWELGPGAMGQVTSGCGHLLLRHSSYPFSGLQTHSRFQNQDLSCAGTSSILGMDWPRCLQERSPVPEVPRASPPSTCSAAGL